MSENPYAAPAAEVADVGEAEASLQRPQIVTIAVWLLWLQVLITIPGPVIAAFNLGILALTPQNFSVLFTLLMAGFKAFLTWRAGEGRNWARVAHLVVLLLGEAIMIFSYVMIRRMLPGQDYSLIDFDNPVGAMVFLVNHVLAIAAVVMLFTPAANDWYRAMRSVR